MDILYDSKYEDIKASLERLKDRGGKINLADLKVILTPARAQTTIRNLKKLRILEVNGEGFKVTEIGHKLIFSQLNDKKKILFQSLNLLDPYRNFFKKIQYDNSINEFNSKFLQDIWGRSGIAVSKRTLSSAFPLFCAILEELDFGVVKPGVFIFSPNYKEVLQNLELDEDTIVINNSSKSLERSKDSLNIKEIPSDGFEQNDISTDLIPFLSNFKIQINSKMSKNQINTIFDGIERIISAMNKNKE
ncbi:MAG: hypothetical protein ACFFAS_01910 [Promethearchaeota archaeon]